MATAVHAIEKQFAAKDWNSEGSGIKNSYFVAAVAAIVFASKNISEGYVRYKKPTSS